MVESPLFKAVELGNKELVQLLLDHVISIDSINKYGNIPIMIARLTGNPELEQTLMDYMMKARQDL